MCLLLCFSCVTLIDICWMPVLPMSYLRAGPGLHLSLDIQLPVWYEHVVGAQ